MMEFGPSCGVVGSLSRWRVRLGRKVGEARNREYFPQSLIIAMAQNEDILDSLAFKLPSRLRSSPPSQINNSHTLHLLLGMKRKFSPFPESEERASA